MLTSGPPPVPLWSSSSSASQVRGLTSIEEHSDCEEVETMEQGCEGHLHNIDKLMRFYHEELLAKVNQRLESTGHQIIERIEATEKARKSGDSLQYGPSFETRLHGRGSRDRRRDSSDSHKDDYEHDKKDGERHNEPATRIARQTARKTSSQRLPMFPTAATHGRSSQVSANSLDFLDKVDKERQVRARATGEVSRTSVVEDDSKNRLQKFMSSTAVDVFFGIAILSNAMFIGIQTEYSAKQLTNVLPESFAIVSACYTGLFVIELVLKLSADRWTFFTCPDLRYWNIMDFVVASTSLFETSVDLYMRFSGKVSHNGSTTSQFRMLRIIRITRLVRILRITRVVRFIRALRTLVYQILFTMKSLIWAVLLLVLVIFLWGTLLTQGVVEYLVQKGDGLEGAARVAEIRDFSDPLQHYWSTLPRSMLTLYQIITGGVTWEDCFEPLYAIGAFPIALLILYIAFTQLAVLNVLTGVFCQNAIESARHDQDLAAQQVLADKSDFCQRIRQIFTDIDVDGSGGVTIQEFTQHLNDERVRAYFESMDLDTSDVWTLFKLLDTDEGNEIDVDEFVSGCLRLKGTAKGVDIAKLGYEQKLLMRRLGQFMRQTEKSLNILANASHSTEALAVPGQRWGQRLGSAASVSSEAEGMQEPPPSSSSPVAGCRLPPRAPPAHTATARQSIAEAF